MPLPTTFAGVSVRGQGGFTYAVQNVYKFTDWQSTSNTAFTPKLLTIDSSGNMYFATQDISGYLWKVNSSFVVQWTIQRNAAIFDAAVDNTNNTITIIDGSYVTNLSMSNGSVNWQYQVRTSLYSVTLKKITSDLSGNFWVTYGQLTRSGSARFGYTYTQAANGYAKINSTGVTIINEYSPAINGIASSTSGTIIIVGSDSSGPFVNAPAIAGGYMASADSNYSTFSSSNPFSVCIDSAGTYCYVPFRNAAGGGMYYDSLIMKGSISSSLGSAFQPAISFLSPTVIPYITDICMDPSNNIYVLFWEGLTGYYYLAKINSSLTLQWCNQITDGNNASVNNIKYHPTLGIIISGNEYQSGSTTLRDTFILNVPTDGSHNGHSSAINVNNITIKYFSISGSLYSSLPSAGKGIGASGGLGSTTATAYFSAASVGVSSPSFTDTFTSVPV